MSLEDVSKHVAELAAAQRTSDHAIEQAITSLAVAYKGIADASEHVAALSGNAKSGALPELAEYLATARELLPELALVLSAMNKTKKLSEFTTIMEMFIKDAKAGMQAKRLAKWEVDTLREFVVEALGGEAKVGQ